MKITYRLLGIASGTLMALSTSVSAQSYYYPYYYPNSASYYPYSAPYYPHSMPYYPYAMPYGWQGRETPAQGGSYGYNPWQWSEGARFRGVPQWSGEMRPGRSWGYPDAWWGPPNPYTGGYGAAPWTVPQWTVPTGYGPYGPVGGGAPPYGMASPGAMPPFGYPAPYLPPSLGHGFSPSQSQPSNVCR
jgi:hypothetical protein